MMCYLSLMLPQSVVVSFDFVDFVNLCFISFVNDNLF